jgi:transcriptional regulator with XRE-family HTH domain/molybdopterin-binding protein
MVKLKFGSVLKTAREAKAYSLRELGERVGIEYSRLARIEHGTRPAPGLAEIRRLSDALDVDMADLLVAAGTSREVMGHLLWSERSHAKRSKVDEGPYLPEWSPLVTKNRYRVRVLRRDGALCTVALGRCELSVFSFSVAPYLSIRIPPETVVVVRGPVESEASTVDNVLPVRVKKVRRLGQVTNLVLSGDGFEMNSLHAGRRVARLGLAEGKDAFATVQATAIRTELTS